LSFLLSLINVTGVISTRENCVHLLDFLNTITVAGGGAGGGKGAQRWGMQKKHRSKQTIAGGGSSWAGGRMYNKWCLKKKLDHPNTFFPNSCYKIRVPSAVLFYVLNCLFKCIFAKYLFCHFYLPHIATKHPDTVAYVVKRHGIATKRTQTHFRVAAASSAKSQVAFVASSAAVRRQPVSGGTSVLSIDASSMSAAAETRHF